MRKRTLAERLWSRVDDAGGLLACWPFMGARFQRGYGAIGTDEGQRGTHVVALELAIGRHLEPGEESCHTCDNPPCCNPAHLFVGTHLINLRDAKAKGRNAAGARNGQARLTVDQVREIRRARKGGEQLRPIADRFGISMTNASAICRGRLWASVT